MDLCPFPTLWWCKTDPDTICMRQLCVLTHLWQMRKQSLFAGYSQWNKRSGLTTSKATARLDLLPLSFKPVIVITLHHRWCSRRQWIVTGMIVYRILPSTGGSGWSKWTSLQKVQSLGLTGERMALAHTATSHTSWSESSWFPIRGLFDVIPSDSAHGSLCRKCSSPLLCPMILNKY